MYQVEVNMICDVKTEEGVKELKKLEHHIENMIDMKAWPEIDCIHHVKVKDITAVNLNKITPKTYL